MLLFSTVAITNSDMSAANVQALEARVYGGGEVVVVAPAYPEDLGLRDAMISVRSPLLLVCLVAYSFELNCLFLTFSKPRSRQLRPDSIRLVVVARDKRVGSGMQDATRSGMSSDRSCLTSQPSW